MATHTIFDKSRLPSRHATVGPDRAPHRSYYYAMGLTRGRHRAAVRRRGDHLERGRALQHLALAPGPGGQARRRQGRRHAARVHHHHRDRRHRHGPPGHEVLAGLARGDRRFHRAHRARPRLRRPGRPRRLRQVAARPDDGDGAPERAGRVHVRRQHPARPLPEPRRHRGRRVRGGRQACDRRDERCRARRARARRLPLGRLLRRPVHRQHHGLRLGGDRPGAARLRRHARALRDPRPVCRGARARRSWTCSPRTSGRATSSPARARERGDRGRGVRRLDQRRPAPAGDRARGRDRLRPGRRLRDLSAHALHRRPQARRPVRDARPARRRRRADADAGAARRRLPARRLHHRDRQDDRREPGGRQVQPRSGRDPHHHGTRSRRSAAWSGSRATSRPRAAS